MEFILLSTILAFIALSSGIILGAVVDYFCKRLANKRSTI